MIYDTFPFFNELELLEVRLHELDPVVDRFVLAESTRTFSNQPKPLCFRENRARFERFQAKLIHVVVDDMPDSADAWALEDHQRVALTRGLAGCQPDDLILHSDVDEIPRASVVAGLRRQMVFRDGPLTRAGHGLLRQPWVVRGVRNLFKKYHPFVWVLEQRLFYFYLNSESANLPCWRGTRAVLFRDFTSAYDLRRWDGHRVASAGWHFSYMGGAERVREKIQAYAHQEYNRPEYTDLQRIQNALRDGQWLLGNEHQLRTVELDDSFPRFILDHRERFSGWIRALAGAAKSGEGRR